MTELEKKWSQDYERTKGQSKEHGVASKRQYGFMQAVAAGKVAGKASSIGKDYIKNSPKKDDLPDSGEGRKKAKRKKLKAIKKAMELLEAGLEISAMVVFSNIADELEKTEQDELLEEHRRLVGILRSGDKKKIKEELDRQEKELQEVYQLLFP